MKIHELVLGNEELKIVLSQYENYWLPSDRLSMIFFICDYENFDEAFADSGFTGERGSASELFQRAFVRMYR